MLHLCIEYNNRDTDGPPRGDTPGPPAKHVSLLKLFNAADIFCFAVDFFVIFFPLMFQGGVTAGTDSVARYDGRMTVG